MSVIALDVKDKQLADTLDSLHEAIEVVKRMQAQLKEELEKLKQDEPTKLELLKAAEPHKSSPTLSDTAGPVEAFKSHPMYPEILKFKESDVVKNPDKYMKPRTMKLMSIPGMKPLLAPFNFKPFKPIGGLNWDKPCLAEEGIVTSSSRY